jgi:hypothetical protein
MARMPPTMQAFEPAGVPFFIRIALNGTLGEEFSEDFYCWLLIGEMLDNGFHSYISHLMLIDFLTFCVW